MVSKVSGHLVLIRSEATTISSSSSSTIASFPVVAAELGYGFVGSGDWEVNQVEGLARGGAWSSGYCASCTIFLKPT